MPESVSEEHGSSVKTERGRNLRTRQSTKSNQKVAKIVIIITYVLANSLFGNGY